MIFVCRHEKGYSTMKGELISDGLGFDVMKACMPHDSYP